MGKKWLTFDLDGTLMQNPFVSWVFPEIQSIIQNESGEEIEVTKLLVEKHNERMRDNQIFEAYDWDHIVAELIDDLNISIEIDVEKLVKKHCVDPKIYLLEKNIVENLKKLKSSGFSLAVATNGYFKYQQPVMKVLKIDQLFDEIITPEVCNCAKPSPNMLGSLEGKGEIIAHIGDRIDHDIVMANKLGVTSVFIYRKLPQESITISINERNKNESILKLCEEKWHKENGDVQLPFNENCIPDIIVGSMEELTNHLS